MLEEAQHWDRVLGVDNPDSLCMENKISYQACEQFTTEVKPQKSGEQHKRGHF